ncbi:hypothetical protein PIB30_048938 [Stylosanthes scabra]|uniref:Uncharacterized protein n=1 Tax=Stylosanthes scabra TaxID=79078 RepID=A0ABU6YEK5_9FABA|nr:hypothetical protein [Stylosanthes scabra]
MSLRSQIPKTVSVSLRGASPAHTDQNDTNIPSLVSELRATFLTRDFDRVERALLVRESRLLASIKEKDKEIESLIVKESLHRLDKLNLESQLKNFRNGGAKVLVEVKKEENDGSECMNCLELKNEVEREKVLNDSLRDRNMLLEAIKSGLEKDKKEWDDQRGFVEELMKRNTELEAEKIGLLKEKEKWDDQRGFVEDLVKRNAELEAEKVGLLEEKKKWDDAKGGIDGFKEEECCGAAADEAPVEFWKRKYIEFTERVSRLEREIAENEKLKSLDEDGGGGGGDGSKTEENNKVQIDDSVEKEDALKRNGNVGVSSRDSPTQVIVIPSKDGVVTGASAKGSLGATAVIYIDSDEDECNSQRTLQIDDSKPKFVAHNEIPSSSGAVKRKERPSASRNFVGMNNNVLDGSDSDASSNSCSSSGSLYDMDQLPLSSLTSKKRMRIERNTLLF